MKQSSHPFIMQARICFWLFWGVSIGLWLLSLMPFMPGEPLAGNAMACYVLEVCTILLTVCLVPLALKIVTLPAVRRRLGGEACSPSHLQAKGCLLQLGILWVPAIMGGVCHLLTTSNTGLMCMAIALAASLFCMPPKVPKDIEHQ